MIHETVFCKKPNREYKKSALAVTRNGQMDNLKLSIT